MLPFTTYQIPETAGHQTASTEQWLLIVVRSSETNASNDLLEKIAGALKADFSKNVYLLTLEIGERLNIREINALQPKLMLSFGVSPADLGIWIDLDKPGMRQLEAFCLIYTLPADKLAANANAKKELWGYMQDFLEMTTTHVH